MSIDSSRVVRLGIVYQGRILHEHVMDRRADVTIGRAAGCTVQVDSPVVPDRMSLLIVERGHYFLVVPDAPGARVNLRGGEGDTSGSGGGGGVQTVRGLRAMAVDAFTGGSVSLGELTLLFQFVRADTTPTVTLERTVLRIGIVTDDRLISDAIYPYEKVVTIGNHKNETIVLPKDEYTGGRTVFTKVSGNTVTARFASGTTARVSVGDKPMDLDKLIAAGQARTVGGEVEVTLPVNARGRAIMGPYTILFQVVRQRLTVSAFQKKSLGRAFLDFFMADIVWTCSLLLAFTIGSSLLAEALIWQDAQGKFQKNLAKADETAREKFLEVDVEKKEDPPPEDPKVDEAPIISDKAAEAAEETKKEEKQAKADKKADKGDKGEKAKSMGREIDEAERTAKVRDRVVQESAIKGLQSAGLGAGSKLFGGKGDGPGSVVAREGAFSTGSGKEGTGTADGGSGLGGAKLGDGAKSYSDTGGPSGKGGFTRKQDVVVKEKKEPEKKLIISVGGSWGGGGSDASIASAVKTKVGAKASAVKNCYEKVLRTKPNISGKVTVTFTLGTAGRVTNASVSAPDGELQSCIKARFEEIVVVGVTIPSPQKFSQTYVFSKN